MDPDVPGKYYSKPVDGQDDRAEPYNEEIFRQVYKYEPPTKPSLLQRARSEVRCSKDALLSLLPIVKWLPRYSRRDLPEDLIAGLTVAVMHIPQGMAYAVLGGVEPIIGIYMAFFPVLVYILMGTSRHLSMGTFAVLSMMTAKCVDALAHTPDETAYHVALNGTSVVEVRPSPTATEVATAVCFVVGVWQLLLSIFKLGTLSVLLSNPLISGFTTGASIHVFTSQVKSLLGLHVKRYAGPLKVIYTYYDIFAGIGNANAMAVGLSASTLACLVTVNEVVKPFLQRKFKRVVPIPIELLIVIAGTLLSTHFDLKGRYGLPIVERIPTGLPLPSVPPPHLYGKVVVDGLVIAIVSVSINISLASIFGKKLNYKIDGNQEILASGAGNIFGSFFSCMPFGASLSRSLIQQTVGGKTQLASVVSCALLVFVLLFIGPFFEPLPYCVLSSIIVVALKGMFLQFKDLPRIWKLSKLDGFVWIVTFLSVVAIDIDYGLGIGIVASVATMIYRAQNPRVAELGRIPDTRLYLDRRLYKTARPVDNMILAKILGDLHFANVDAMRKQVLALLPDSATPARKSIVFNMAAISHMDPSAIECLRNLCSDLNDTSIPCVLCEFVPCVYDSLKRCNFFATFPASLVFPTMDNAIEYLQKSESLDSSGRVIFHVA